MRRAGLDTIVTKHYPMYPDLVRQFFATVTMYSEVQDDKDSTNAGCWILTFMIHGVWYRVSFQDLRGIYDFYPDHATTLLPDKVLGHPVLLVTFRVQDLQLNELYPH